MSERINDDIIAGAFAGAIARLLTAPFDVYKIRAQLNVKGTRPSMFQEFSNMIREEGFFSLWKGNLSGTYLWVTYAMVQFGAYGLLKSLGERMIITSKSETTDANRRSNSYNKIMKTAALFLAGAGAGMAATAATYPFDIMRTSFAVQGKERVYNSMSQFIVGTVRDRGISGLYTGLTPAVIGIAPYMGLNFAIYESSKNFLENAKRWGATDSKDDSAISVLKRLAVKGLAGGFAGGASKFIVYPLDTVKKRLQAQILRSTLDKASHVPKYQGIVDCFRQTLIQEGVQGLYKGILPTLVKSVVATSLTFAAFEGAKDVLGLTRSWRRVSGSRDR